MSDGPAIIHAPTYNRFFRISIFDINHNTYAVIVNPDLLILITRPGQPIPKGSYGHVVNLETDQGLVSTRMLVDENLGEVPGLGKSITMDGGKGDMNRNVQRFPSEIEWQALEIIDSIVLNGSSPSVSFGKRSSDVGELSLAAGGQQGQLDTPPDAVGYNALFTDTQGEPFNGEDSHKVTVPVEIVRDDGYLSITVYGPNDKLLISNDQNGYDRTTFLSGTNEDESHTVTHSRDDSGENDPDRDAGLRSSARLCACRRSRHRNCCGEAINEHAFRIILRVSDLQLCISGPCIGGQNACHPRQLQGCENRSEFF
ncbi:DUF1254 domain-containing protein [Ruegeria atlantica]|uniref:DUF1254 domain-containing protein n=1 Tax=Ruegeria atlantica TaxID=81569 RepID=UPI002494FE30|nr:DUF1254 domain-containing protein [Ruegeria atlantica]